jgi:cytoskeletal protein RodZ
LPQILVLNRPKNRPAIIYRVAIDAIKTLNNSEMSSVAEQLRAAREAKNLTIEQVADLTKIRTDHVRALEEGDFTAFSAPIYIRGSVRSYAALLKIDVTAILAALNAELKGTQQFSEPPPLVEQKKTLVDTFTLALAKLNWRAGFVGFVAVVIVGGFAIGWMSWRHHSKRSDPLKNVSPVIYQSDSGGDTLALPKH